MNKKELSKAMSIAAKIGHKKSPRSKEHYSKIGKVGAQKRWGKESVDYLSPDVLAE